MCVCWSWMAPVSHLPLSSSMSKSPRARTAAPRAPAGPPSSLQPRAQPLNTRPRTTGRLETANQALCGALNCRYFNTSPKKISMIYANHLAWSANTSAPGTCSTTALAIISDMLIKVSFTGFKFINLNIIHCDSALCLLNSQLRGVYWKICLNTTVIYYIYEVKIDHLVKPALIKRQLSMSMVRGAETLLFPVQR